MRIKILFLLFFSALVVLIPVSLCAAPVNITAKTQASDNVLSARLDSIERGLNVLQKYVYNLNSSRNTKTSRNIGINADEISEQFHSMRAHMENIKQEINHLSSRITTSISEIENRITDLEEVAEKRKHNQKIIESINSHLNEIEILVPNSDTTINDITSEAAVETQFKNAYNLLKDKKFDDAQESFTQFIKENHSSTLVGAAHYWIGEIYSRNQEYDKAAIEYLHGYQVGPYSGRAPDNLLKLAESLLKIGKRQECCATLKKFNQEFPNPSITIKRTASQLLIDAVCE